MPWKQVDTMTQRQLFINDWLSRAFSMRHLCGRYDISPKTGYKWVLRFRAKGVAGLVDHSRARHTQAHRVSPEMSGIILQCKYSYPRWGPKTIHSWLYRTHPDLEAPAVSTIGEILNKRAGEAAQEAPQDPAPQPAVAARDGR